MELIQQLMQARSWEERYRLIIRAGNNLPQPNDTELSAMQSAKRGKKRPHFLLSGLQRSAYCQWVTMAFIA